MRFELLNMIRSGVNVKFEKCPQRDSDVIKEIGEEHTALMIDSYLRAKRIDSFYKSESLKEARSSRNSKDFSGEMSDSDFIKEFGISRNTFYKYKRELKK